MKHRGVLVLLAMLPALIAAAGHATPIQFGLGIFSPPQSINGPVRLPDCTLTYLTEDYVNNETYAQRMVFTPAPDAVPTKGVMPCPSLMSGRVAQATLTNCQQHAAHKADCVFADMNRGFHDKPGIASTAESTSRCASDEASHIGIACWRSGKTDICNVGCGNSAQAAISAARDRCERTHRQQCTITGALPVAAK